MPRPDQPELRRVRRGLVGRLFGGFLLQWFLTSYVQPDIEQLRFGGVLRATGGGGGGTPAILVYVGGHKHVMGPALGVRTARLVEFGNELIELAAAHGVAIGVQAGNRSWDGLHGA